MSIALIVGLSLVMGVIGFGAGTFINVPWMTELCENPLAYVVAMVMIMQVSCLGQVWLLHRTANDLYVYQIARNRDWERRAEAEEARERGLEGAVE